MWSYFGTKKGMAEHYPKPKFDKIIEPFCGAAAYSMQNWQKEVYLYDKYYIVTGIWKWLINEATVKDIQDIELKERGQMIRRIDYGCDAQFHLAGFLCGAALASPGKTVTEYGRNYAQAVKDYMVGNLFKVKHWKIKKDVYWNLKNEEATWFIDPPYQFGGQDYVHSNKDINYKSLAKWCQERQGQIIICENTKANWMPFKPVRQIKGAVHKTTEAIWSNYETAYDIEQLKLF